MNGRALLVERARAGRALGLPASRAARFGVRSGGGRPARLPLSAVAAWPRWPGWDAGAQARLHRILGLVMARDALAQVIDGERLRAYAALVGEGALDQILALPAGGHAPLVRPRGIEDAGKATARAALPPELVDGAPRRWAELRDTVAIAERIAEARAS